MDKKIGDTPPIDRLEFTKINGEVLSIQEVVSNMGCGTQPVLQVKLPPEEKTSEEDPKKKTYVLKKCGKYYEAKLVAFVERLKISGILESLEILTCDKDKWLLYPFYECGDLDQFLKKMTEVLPLEVCNALFAEVIKTLLALHAKGVLHRDIKPDNLFVWKDKEGRLHLLVGDFGGAQNENEDGNPNHLGTFDYLPDKFYPDEGHLFTAEHDFYGLGASACVLYTGVPLFDADYSHRYQIMQALRQEKANHETLFTAIEEEVKKHNKILEKMGKKTLRVQMPSKDVQCLIFDMLSMKEASADDYLLRMSCLE